MFQKQRAKRGCVFQNEKLFYLIYFLPFAAGKGREQLFPAIQKCNRNALPDGINLPSKSIQRKILFVFMYYRGYLGFIPKSVIRSLYSILPTADTCKSSRTTS